MRRVALLLATAVLLAGPAVLAFLTGGYFDGPRYGALVAAWLIVLLLALAGPLPLPQSTLGRIVAGALAGLVAWSAISIWWAPLAGPAFDSVSRLLLYLGVLLASIALLRAPRVVRAVEPVLALGALAAIGYGLSDRLLPGILEEVGMRSFKSSGRLEVPITYWNSEGLLAGIGLILCARLAGDRSRPAAMRIVAAAASLPLGAGVYLTYSRGALAVSVLGLLVLLAVSPTKPQLRALGIAMLGAVVMSACAAALPGVASAEGSATERERDGLIMLVILLAGMGGAAFASVRALRAERASTAMDRLSFARMLPATAAAAAALCICGLVAGGLGERGGEGEPVAPNASRFSSVKSARYEYWTVGLRAFAENPLQGVGAGSFRVYWRQERSVAQGVREAHSLQLEMASELGLPGLTLMLVLLGAVAVALRRALRAGAPIAVSSCAVLSAWLLHASIDWDWQLPAVVLPAVILTGAVLAALELGSEADEREEDGRMDYLERPPEFHPTPYAHTGALADRTGSATG